MPGPVVYVVAALGTIAAIFAFKEFVYEPHIAPTLEVWAQQFIESRKQRRRVLNKPHTEREQGDENSARRSGDGRKDKKRQGDEEDMVVELEQLHTKDVNKPRDSMRQSSLRHRRPVSVMDEGNSNIPYALISPTHVIADSPTSSSPATPYKVRSPPGSPSLRSPSPTDSLGRSEPRSPPGLGLSSRSQRPLTPVSLSSGAASRTATPEVTGAASMRSFRLSSAPPRSLALSPGLSSMDSYPSSRSITPDSADVPVPMSMYSTALSAGPPATASAPQLEHDPFFNGHAVWRDSHTELVTPSLSLHLDEASRDHDDMMSVSSEAISSASGSALDDDILDVLSQHGSDESNWVSVGRRTPEV